jgi:hypothetical protein
LQQHRFREAAKVSRGQLSRRGQNSRICLIVLLLLRLRLLQHLRLFADPLCCSCIKLVVRWMLQNAREIAAACTWAVTSEAAAAG